MGEDYKIACIQPSDRFPYSQIFEDIFNDRNDADIRMDLYKPHRGDFPEDYRLPTDTEYDGVLVTGSGEHLYDDSGEHVSNGDQEDWNKETQQYVAQALQEDIPVIGVCYGHQLVADTLADGPVGETVEPMTEREMGFNTIELTAEGDDHPLMDGLDQEFTSFTSHLDYVPELPENTAALAENEYSNHAFAAEDTPAYGVQFHPEYDREMAEKLLESKDLDPESDKYSDIVETLTDENAAAAEGSRRVFDNFLELID